jgi:PAS domain S-box-containing protein
MIRSIRVLCVDDSEDDTALLLRALESYGISPTNRRVDTRESLALALQEEDWDVVLIDYTLPSFSGLEALSTIRATAQHPGLVIVSGSISEDMAVDILSAGAHDYVLKDNLKRLGPAVDRALREARARVRQEWAEEELRRSEARYRQLHQSMRDGFVRVDMEGRILETNTAFQTMLGFEAEELNALDYRTLIPEKWHALEAHMLSTQVLPLGYSNVYEKEYRRKDGRAVFVEARRVLLRDNEGRPASIWSTVRDITERKGLEMQLQHAQKMEAVGQLAGGVAHDFNNILTAIIGFGSFLQRKLADDKALCHNVDQIIAAAERAAQLTQSLLTFSRKQAINLKPVDLNVIIQRLEKLLLRIIGEDIQLTTSIHPEELVVQADSGQLEQVLMNLAANSRDAMPIGGSIVISTRPIEMDAGFIAAHGYGEPGVYALVTFEDTGTGMDRGTQEKIFEPFFTTKEVGKGTGLGLSIAYGIVKQHHGIINVYSEQGNGTTFRIYLPLTALAVTAPVLRTAAVEEHGTETILIGEDDAGVRELTRMILEQSGYTVIEACDGEDALVKYGQNKGAVSLIILDIIMPKRGGKSVADEIARENPLSRVLFVSGYTANIIRQNGILEEGLNFISKPFSPQELLNKVREVLDQ